MCRLFGAVSLGPVYYELFEEFADLAVRGNTPRGGPDERGHRDGWGLAFYRNGSLVDHVRGVGSAEGDPQYFKAAWKVATPILDVWKALPPRDFPNYAAGTWGPKSADELIERDGRRWVEPC